MDFSTMRVGTKWGRGNNISVLEKLFHSSARFGQGYWTYRLWEAETGEYFLPRADFYNIYVRLWNGLEIFTEWFVSLRQLVKELKKGSVFVFKEHCETRLFTIKLQVSDRLLCGLGKACKPKPLDTSAYENFNVVSKRAYQRPSMRRVGRMQETYCPLEGKEIDRVFKNASLRKRDRGSR